MTPLFPCPECARHVRVGEPSCPFCSTAIPVQPVVRPAPQIAGLGRAAIMAFGTAAALTVSACGDDGPPPGPLYGTPAVDAGEDAGAPAPEYGTPSDAGPEMDSGNSAALYGGAP